MCENLALRTDPQSILDPLPEIGWEEALLQVCKQKLEGRAPLGEGRVSG